jgi:hypothetical protein
MLEKAPSLGADVVMLDLEDAVAPDDKEQARINLVDALREQDWSCCSVSVRINGLDTHWCYRDIVDVVEQAGEHVDAIVIPKVSGAGDVHLVATLLTQIEEAMGIERRIGLAVLIETAIGMVNVDEVAQACPERMEAMIFGVADYAASIQSHTASIGGARPPLGRPVALPARAHRGHLPGLWAAADRRPVRRLHRPGGIPGGRAPLRGARLRGQVGDPPLAGAARERGLHAGAAARGAHAAHHRGDARGGRGR